MTIWNPSPHDQIGAPRVQFNAISGDFASVERQQEPDGEWTEFRQTVGPGSKLAIDFGSLEVGPLKFSSRGPDFSRLRPIGQPALEAGDDPDFKEGFRVSLLLKGFGRRVFASNSVLVNGTMKTLFDNYSFATEAQRGDIPTYTLLPPRQVRIVVRNESFYAPEFELVGWIDRKEAVFGRRLVPPPTPLLGRENVPTEMPQRPPSRDARYNALQHQQRTPPPAKPPARPQADPDLDDEIPW